MLMAAAQDGAGLQDDAIRTLETVARGRTRRSFAGIARLAELYDDAAPLRRRGGCIRPRAGGQPARRPRRAAGRRR